jgi:hypothetical protein
MALRVAVANGDWSSPSTWNGGILPTVGDVVASNGFTVTIDEDINVDSITNTAQNSISIIPIMTSATSPSGTVTVSSQEPSVYLGWKAFDGVVSAANSWNPNAASPSWIEYQFPTSKTIVAYSVTNGATDWQFQAWNGSTWVVLDTVTGAGSSATTVRTFSNTTAYTRYRLYVTGPASSFYLYELKMFDVVADSSSAVQGGTFNLNSGVTVTCTGGNGIYAGINTCLTYSGTGTSTINANINPLTVSAASNTFTLVHNGTGTLNINGNINASGTNGFRCCLDFSGTGVCNVVGNFFGGFGNSPNARATSSGRLNIIGTIAGGSNVTSLDLSGTTVTTITGNLTGGTNSGRPVVINGNAVLTITGNLLHGDNGGPALRIDSGTPNINIIGNVGSTFANSSTLLSTVAGSYIKVIGTIFAGLNYNFYSASPSAINILTGPFISYATGIHPFWVIRMHYQRTIGSYFEFRDNSTNGAVPPAGPAPITRLVSPGTAIDAPAASDVRQGVVYAAASLTGTMVVPAASNVANNVPVDNTVGTAVLDPNAIWAVPLTSVNTLNSIGRRVKNAATVETTGAQLESLIRDNE